MDNTEVIFLSGSIVLFCIIFFVYNRFFTYKYKLSADFAENNKMLYGFLAVLPFLFIFLCWVVLIKLDSARVMITPGLLLIANSCLMLDLAIRKRKASKLYWLPVVIFFLTGVVGVMLSSITILIWDGLRFHFQLVDLAFISSSVIIISGLV